MKFTISLVLMLFFVHCIFAQNTNYRNEFGFRSDNDAYLAIAQDQYYTNGLFITFRRALKSRSSRLEKKILEVEAGQEMYNANSGQTDYAAEVDRPFTAYLYGGLKANWYSKKESLLSAALQVGTIGPGAHGKEVQETLHNVVGFYKINGWQYQLNSELGLNSSVNYSKLLGRKENDDLIFSGYINIGNTFSGAGASLLVRTGKINSISNSASFHSRISSRNDTLTKTESFFFIKPVLNFVAYNATIQGGMFRRDKGPVSFAPNPLLFSTELGYTYAKNRWSFNFSLTFQTKELKEQKESHQYGSISLYYLFN